MEVPQDKVKKEGADESVTNCHQLKMTAADGKKRLTDVLDATSVEMFMKGIDYSYYYEQME